MFRQDSLHEGAMSVRLILPALLLLLPVGAAATAPCAPPSPVAAYLKAHPGWRILDMPDLVSDDQQLWRENHKGLCPGLARVVVEDGGGVSFALALIRPRGGKIFEQVVVLRALPGGTFQPVMLVAPDEGAGIVVWRTPPDKFTDWYGTGQAVVLRHDGIVWEKMEAAAQVFYFVRGKVRMIQTSD
jgi:hypothetical protein